MSFEKSKLVILTSLERPQLDLAQWDSEVLDHTSFYSTDIVSGPECNSLYQDCLEVTANGKCAAFILRNSYAACSAIKAAKEEFHKLGSLIVANNPHESTSLLPKGLGSVALSLQSDKKVAKVETIGKKYLQWMKSQDAGWDTVCFDIVGALPRFSWVSVNCDSLESLTLYEFKTLFKVLAQNKIIVGFDIFNSDVEKMPLLAQALAQALLVSQGRISEDDM